MIHLIAVDKIKFLNLLCTLLAFTKKERKLLYVHIAILGPLFSFQVRQMPEDAPFFSCSLHQGILPGPSAIHGPVLGSRANPDSLQYELAETRSKGPQGTEKRQVHRDIVKFAEVILCSQSCYSYDIYL